MKPSFPCTLFAALACLAVSAHAQYLQTHGASISVGATGQFSTLLTSNPTPNAPYSYPTTAGTLASTTVSNQQQFTTWSTGFVTSFQFHPVSWAGIALNYGFTHYQERFQYTEADTGATNQQRDPVDMHEFTGGYEFHPKHIPLQPYVIVGGGAIDFTSAVVNNQFRGAGYLETGIDLPVHSEHVGFRISGRELVYRAPNFNETPFSVRGWRSTEEPTVSTYIRF